MLEHYLTSLNAKKAALDLLDTARGADQIERVASATCEHGLISSQVPWSVSGGYSRDSALCSRGVGPPSSPQRA